MKLAAGPQVSWRGTFGSTICEGLRDCAIDFVETFSLIADYEPAIIGCQAGTTPFNYSFSVSRSLSAANDSVSVLCNADGANLSISGNAAFLVVNTALRSVELDPNVALDTVFTLTPSPGSVVVAPLGSTWTVVHERCVRQASCAYPLDVGYNLIVKYAPSRLYCDSSDSLFPYTFAITSGTGSVATVTCGANLGAVTKTGSDLSWLITTSTSRAIELSPVAAFGGDLLLTGGSHVSFSTDSDLPQCDGEASCAIDWRRPFSVSVNYEPSVILCDTNSSAAHTVLLVHGIGTPSASVGEVSCSPGRDVLIQGKDREPPSWLRGRGMHGVELDPIVGLDRLLFIGSHTGISLVSLDRKVDSSAAVCTDETACIFAWSRGFQLALRVVGTVGSTVYDDVTSLAPLSAAQVEVTTATTVASLTFKTPATCGALRVISGQTDPVPGSHLQTVCLFMTTTGIADNAQTIACHAAIDSSVISSDSTAHVCDRGTARCIAEKTGRIRYARWRVSEDQCGLGQGAVPVSTPGTLEISAALLSGLLPVNSLLNGDGPNAKLSSTTAVQVQSAIESAAAAGSDVFVEVQNQIAALGYAISYVNNCQPCQPGRSTSGARFFVCLPCDVGSARVRDGSVAASDAMDPLRTVNSFSAAQTASELRQGGAGRVLVICDATSAAGQRLCWREAACTGEIQPGKLNGCSVLGVFEDCPVCDRTISTGEDDSVTALSVIGVVALCVTAAVIALLVCLVMIGVLCGAKSTKHARAIPVVFAPTEPHEFIENPRFSEAVGPTLPADSHSRIATAATQPEASGTILWTGYETRTVSEPRESRNSGQFVLSPAHPLPKDVVADW